MSVSKASILKQVSEYSGGKVKLAVTDLDGVLRGKVIHLDKFKSIIDGGFGFCSVVFGWDANDLCYENKIDFTGWHTGYQDAAAQVDLNTFRQVPWDNNIPFFLADFVNKDGSGLDICPRSLLKKIKSNCEAKGFSSSFSQEFEWFNFKETAESLEDKGFQNLQTLTRGMFGYSILRAGQNGEFFNELFDALKVFKIPIEGLHTETGPGVYEAAIIYDDILESADRAVLFKSAVKEIGYKYGIMPTFMAKWSDDYPGCGGHLHQSLWRDGKNVFFDESGDRGMSEMMKSYMAGILHCLPLLTPMYAPTINSYKRLAEGAWAPTTLTWGVDNRTVALRALPGSENSTRMELRVVGSDVNPYLAMAASLASGMYGIENDLKLDEVYAETIGNGYKNTKNGVILGNLWESAKAMRSSEIARELLGDKFVDHFCASREWEWQRYCQSVSDWELKRYFEII